MREPIAALRRLLVGCALMTFAVTAAAGCDGSPDADKRPTTSTSASASDAREARAAASRRALRRALGMKIMTPMSGTWPSRILLKRVRRGEVGGILVFGANVSDRLPGALGALREAAKQGGGRGLIIAIDQEGGTIRRLSASPPTLSAGQMGSAGTQTAFAQGRATGEALRATGINADLAPVADVQGPGGFLGDRAFGTSAGTVARRACAFARGLRQGRVHATLKHFPGLGQAPRNTDISQVSLSTPRAKLLADLEPFRRCARQVAMVMLSNAAYPTLTGSLPAAFDPAIIRVLLRRELRFRGVTISDALTAPGVSGPGAALRASRAGIDMLLYTDENVSAFGYRELLAGLRAGQLSPTEVHASARRIRALQE